MTRRRNQFRFTGKSHSKKGIAVSFASVVSLVVYAVFVAISINNQGTLSMYYGSVGVIWIVESLLAVIFAIQSIREEDSFPLFPRMGMVLSVLSLLTWAGTYGLGMMG